MKKNNKGFTLIELLAVIVVLAIIMVIATQQINKTIKKSRGDSFYDSLLMIEKNGNLLCAQNNGEISINDLKETSNIDDDDANYIFAKGADDTHSVEVTGQGKFANMEAPTDTKSTISVSGQKGTITFGDCTIKD